MSQSSENKDFNSFCSKILLFGEYSIIQNSMGLSVPYDSFQGKLSFIKGEVNNETIVTSNFQLREFYKYLLRLQIKGDLLAPLDLKAMKEDLRKGLFFDSSIPQGYGVGSSGALCAAIYDQYATSKVFDKEPTSNDLLQLKLMFAQMESYFHGKSSGTDPLICYIQMPVLIKSKTRLNKVKLPQAKTSGSGAIFLLNTGMQGKTQPLVELFLDKCKQNEFLDEMRTQFIPYNDNSIKAFIKGETKALFYNLYFLSKFLFENLSPMIPQLFRELWKKGLDTGAFYLKLCGSGGGGFILGFTENFEKAQDYLKDYQVKVIHRF